MSGAEPPGAQDSLKPVARGSMQRPSIQMGAGGLPSAAEIWSTGAEAPAPPTLRDPTCPKLLVATTRVRDGRLQLFRNQDLTADVVLASTCPALVRCAVEIAGT